MKDEVLKPVSNQTTTDSVKPKKMLSYNPSAIFTPTKQASVQPTVNQHIKFPKLALPEFSGNPLEQPELSSLFFAIVDNAGIDDS